MSSPADVRAGPRYPLCPEGQVRRDWPGGAKPAKRVHAPRTVSRALVAVGAADDLTVVPIVVGCEDGSDAHEEFVEQDGVTVSELARALEFAVRDLRERAVRRDQDQVADVQVDAAASRFLRPCRSRRSPESGSGELAGPSVALSLASHPPLSPRRADTRTRLGRIRRAASAAKPDVRSALSLRGARKEPSGSRAADSAPARGVPCRAGSADCYCRSPRDAMWNRSNGGGLAASQAKRCLPGVRAAAVGSGPVPPAAVR
jgi:hypothetical protein